MRRIIRAAAPAGLLVAALAAVAVAGCSASSPAAYRATAATCYAFGVRALQRHVTVTTVPRACRGLSHGQINLAAARAVREVVGPRPKAAARRLANRDSAYLGHLFGPVPAAAPGATAAGTAPPAAGLSASLAALGAWVLTAAAGSYLLAGMLAPGGRRLRTGRVGGLPPAIIVGHFALAVVGLGIWIAFVASGVAALAWTAAGLILPTAGLGMATLAAALPEPAPGARQVSPGPPSTGTPSTGTPSTGTPSTGTPSTGPALATRAAEATAPGRRRLPVTVIAVHGMLATATILLVLLAAIGAS